MTMVSKTTQNKEGNMSSVAKKSNDGSFFIMLSWDPLELKEGSDTIFLVSFFDPKTNLEIRQIDYSFKAIFSFIYTTIKDVKHQKAPGGIGVQIVNFPMPGPVDIAVNITQPQQNLSSVSNNT
jgi:hypothetical protein